MGREGSWRHRGVPLPWSAGCLVPGLSGGSERELADFLEGDSARNDAPEDAPQVFTGTVEPPTRVAWGDDNSITVSEK